MNPTRRIAMAMALAVGALVLGATSSSIAQPAAALVVRSSDAGGVRVAVKPKSLSGPDWEFEVVMDTHSKPLDDDLSKIAVLVDDAGRRYTPSAWQGDKPGGHHRKGVLLFTAPSAQIKSFELQIQGLAGTSKRTLQWTIK